MSAARVLAGFVLAALLAGSATAQQPAPDPQLAIYSQLLAEANDRFVSARAQVQALTKELAEAKKALDEAKAKP